MKNTLFCVAIAMATSAVAQTTPQEIKENNAKSAGNYYIYTVPSQSQTPAPQGYKPFYISHYGRHGSRFLIDKTDVLGARDLLVQAQHKGILTTKGRQVIEQLQQVADAMDDREGELTPLGHAQHKGIAQRMVTNFPDVFAKGARIDARATTVVRCVLSMGAFCQQLKEMKPQVEITNDASKHDMYYMCHHMSNSRKKSDPEVAYMRAYDRFCDSLSQPDRLIASLVTDPGFYTKAERGRLSRQIFNVACDVQDMPGMDDLNLFSLFTPQELFNYWQSQNAYWYGVSGLSPVLDGTGPFIATDLLRNIIEQAEEAVEQGKPAATLRFGHDTGILPLVALMDIEGANAKVKDLKDLYLQWADFKIIPMAANLQIVFFKKGTDKNILLKVLLNEREVKLPFNAYSGPYYRWSDFKSYYSNLISKAPSYYVTQKEK